MEVIECKLAKLSNRVADLLNVAIDTNDRLPQCISRKCKPRLETLESAVEDLEAIYIIFERKPHYKFCLQTHPSNRTQL